MKLALIDILIIVGYLVLSVLIGFFVAKKASKNLQNYFLGGNQIPWWMLGLSNASGMFDISGTMWTVAILFVYGLKSAWIPWLWPVWNQIFVMIFLGIWLRRSQTMTGAEWINFRFGEGRGAKLSHIIVVIFAIISVIGFIAYGFIGLGKFAVTFFPWDLSFNFIGLYIESAHSYALIIIAITTLYVIKGGMYSVVGTEVVQFVIMTIACIVVSYIAITQTSAEQISAAVPEGWKTLWFGWNLDLDWSDTLDSVNYFITNDDYNLFGLVIIMMVFKGIFASLAGPVPSYDMQRVLATRSPAESAKMSGLTPLVLFPPRYLMIASLTVLALVYFSPVIKNMGNDIDFEMILPYALSNFVPAGVLGLILAGLSAAFMSTFAAFINAAPAYLVNDIYKKYINPDASSKRYVRMSYISSLGIVIIGVILGFFIQDIDSITKWIVASLYGGYAAANVLKWIWWRFNGYGYFWGMLFGLIGSLIAPRIFPGVFDLYVFPGILVFAFIGSFLGTWLSKPEDDETLMNFYKKTRPWGFWKPIYRKVKAQDPEFKRNKNLGRDAFNVVIGIIWQMTLVVGPIYLIIREWDEMSITILVFLITSFILKKTWWDKLED